MSSEPNETRGHRQPEAMGFRNYILTNDARCINQVQEIKAILIRKGKRGASLPKTDESPTQGCVDKITVHTYNETPYREQKE